MLTRLRAPAWFFRPAVGVATFVISAAVVTAALAPFVDERNILNVALLYLTLTLLAAAIWGYTVGLLAAVISDLLVNFYYVPPLHRFTVHEPANAAALVLFLAVALIGASMLALLRHQVGLSRAGKAEADILLSVSQAIAHATSPQDALDNLCAVAAQALEAQGCSVLRERGGEWRVLAATSDIESRAAPDRAEQALLVEAMRTRAPVGRGGAARRRMRTPRGSRTRSEGGPLTIAPFPPQSGEQQSRESGALRLLGPISTPPLVEQSRLLSAFAAEASVAVQHLDAAREAERAGALERADEFKSTLLSSVSHDLRSPLTAIKASIGNLRDPEVRWSPEDVEDFLATIESQTDRLVAMVTDLLQVERLERGAVRTMIEPLHVGGLLHDAARSASSVSSGRAVEVTAGDELWASADYGLMLEAITNLIENAARYSTPGGAIHIEAAAAPNAVRITVRDEGPGIPAVDLPHIFEKFYRGEQGVHTKGTGLGLAIVKGLVELCGGSVELRSSSDGAAFTVTIPAVETPVVVPVP